MLVLSALTKLLAQVLAPPGLHTAVLLTAEGDLVAFASVPPTRVKDDVRVLVGLASEIWAETRADAAAGDASMVDSEVRCARRVVLGETLHAYIDLGACASWGASSCSPSPGLPQATARTVDQRGIRFSSLQSTRQAR